MSDLERTRYLRELRQGMDTVFDLEEFKVLCFDLEIDYEHLAGENVNKLIKIQSLIFYLGRHGRLHELLELLIEQRPHIEWPKIPDGTERIKQDIVSLEPKALRPDGRLVAGLGVALVFVTCGWLGAFAIKDLPGIMFFFCAPIFLFVAIYGFFLGRHYQSQRAKILSLALGIISSFHIIFLVILALLIVLAIVIFGEDSVRQFINELSLRYGN